MPQFEPDTSEGMISFVPARNTMERGETIELELGLQFFFFFFSISLAFLYIQSLLFSSFPPPSQADVIDGHVREIEREREKEWVSVGGANIHPPFLPPGATTTLIPSVVYRTVAESIACN